MSLQAFDSPLFVANLMIQWCAVSCTVNMVGYYYSFQLFMNKLSIQHQDSLFRLTVIITSELIFNIDQRPHDFYLFCAPCRTQCGNVFRKLLLFIENSERKKNEMKFKYSPTWHQSNAIKKFSTHSSATIHIFSNVFSVDECPQFFLSTITKFISLFFCQHFMSHFILIWLFTRFVFQLCLPSPLSAQQQLILNVYRHTHLSDLFSYTLCIPSKIVRAVCSKILWIETIQAAFLKFFLMCTLHNKSRALKNLEWGRSWRNHSHMITSRWNWFLLLKWLRI